jgi:hypothetical protein
MAIEWQRIVKINAQRLAETDTCKAQWVALTEESHEERAALKAQGAGKRRQHQWSWRTGIWSNARGVMYMANIA